MDLQQRKRQSLLSLSTITKGIVSLSTLAVIGSPVTLMANDWGRCGGRGYPAPQRSFYGSQRVYVDQYRPYSGLEFNAGISNQSCAPAPVRRLPVLDCNTSCWTYRCSIQAYDCFTYFHPQYNCWYYFYPQQNCFLPVQYISHYPPAPQANLNHNLNQNLSQNLNRNDNTNVTNINLGGAALPPGNPGLPNPALDNSNLGNPVAGLPAELVPGQPVPIPVGQGVPPIGQ